MYQFVNCYKIFLTEELMKIDEIIDEQQEDGETYLTKQFRRKVSQVCPDTCYRYSFMHGQIAF